MVPTGQDSETFCAVFLLVMYFLKSNASDSVVPVGISVDTRVKHPSKYLVWDNRYFISRSKVIGHPLSYYSTQHRRRK